MNLLKEEVFYFQFNNQPKVQRPYRRRKTYLCYLLEWPDGSRQPIKGCLQNKKGHHAEIRLIDKICALELDNAKITCYLTWSPCLNCAQELAALKENHPGLKLSIFVSRLYFHWKRVYQKGLQLLHSSSILLDIMGLPEFTDCWENFVSDQKPFQAWSKLNQFSGSIRRRLCRILGTSELNVLVDALGNVRL